jgi:hypothetical protein
VPKKYSPDWWRLESVIDSAQYETIARCVRFVEHQIDEFDDRNQTQFSDEYGTLTQAAFLMITVAQMEHHLQKVCDIIAELRKLRVRPADLTGAKGFEQCIAYLTKVLQIALPEKELTQIRAIVRIRNVWVHGGGYLDDVPQDLGPLRAHLGRNKDNQITFPGSFVQEACKLSGSLVQRVEATVQGQGAQSARGSKNKELAG